MEKKILYRYVSATASPAEEKEVLEYLKSDSRHWDELREIQRQYETALMCAPVINGLHEKDRGTRRVHDLRSFSRIAVAAAAIIVMAVFSWTTLVRDRNAAEMHPMSYCNVMGKSRLVLPDGTVAWLHNNSTLEYGEDFGGECRRVVLKGDAYFDVAKDENRPFIIEVDKFNIEALGTSFDVSSEDDGIDVSLSEGRVRLTAGDSLSKEMTAGHIAHLDRTTSSIDIREGDTRFPSLWAQEKIVFHGESLDEICRILEVWYGREIELDASVPFSRLAFTLTDESLESVLAYIKAINPDISYVFNKDGSVRIR